VKDWLKRLLGPVESPPDPVRFDDDYWAYSTLFDEEIHSESLFNSDHSHDHRNTAYQVFRSASEAVPVERAAIQARTTQLAEEMNASIEVDPISLTILIDHSGSMRGDKVQMAVMIAECAAQLASKLGIAFEVLGFTTTEWLGKPVRGLWTNHGRPANPGRLCALRHIVYSNFSETRLLDMRAMFLPDLLKENVDGEALFWASDRARKSGKSRHLILVVSDGAPVDDSTLSSNTDGFLWDHLVSVTSNLNADEQFVLAGVGLDHDVSVLYAKSLKLRFFGEIEESFLPFLEDCITNAVYSLR